MPEEFSENSQPINRFRSGMACYGGNLPGPLPAATDEQPQAYKMDTFAEVELMRKVWAEAPKVAGAIAVCLAARATYNVIHERYGNA